jgi:hypothetical protein
MASVNQTRPHCVNQVGKTHSKPLAARHGRGTARAQHAMCELVLKEEFLFIKDSCGSSDCSKVLGLVSCAMLSINHAGMADWVHHVRANKRSKTHSSCVCKKSQPQASLNVCG